MSLKSYLNGIETQAGRIARTQLPDVPLVSSAVHQLSETCDAVGNVEIEDPEQFVHRVRVYWTAHQSLKGLSNKDFRACVSLIQQPDVDGDCMAADPELVRAVINRVRETWSKLALRNLTYQYLEGYNPDSPVTDQIYRTIKDAPQKHRPQLLHELHTKGLLNELDGPIVLAAHILKSDDPVDSLLADTRITGPLAQSKFVEQCFKIVCTVIARQSEPSQSQLLRLIDWSEDPSAGSQQRERFPHQTPALARALLLPWASASRSPSSELEAKIKNLLIGSLDDPRFPSASARWHEIDDQAVGVLKRWLNRIAITQFFEIVSKSMDSADGNRMWKSRRRFWTAYLDYIEDAWVVFHTVGTELAERMAIDTDDDSFSQHGKFSRGPYDASHAVLLLTIGDLVIAEWSHNGACRIWKRGDPRAPTTYRQRYDAYALRNGWWKQSHVGDRDGNWQMKVAQKIRNETGVSVSKSAYHSHW